MRCGWAENERGFPLPSFDDEAAGETEPDSAREELDTVAKPSGAEFSEGGLDWLGLSRLHPLPRIHSTESIAVTFNFRIAFLVFRSTTRRQVKWFETINARHVRQPWAKGAQR